MIEADLQGVEFWAINTDAQALAHHSAPNKLQIGNQVRVTAYVCERRGRACRRRLPRGTSCTHACALDWRGAAARRTHHLLRVCMPKAGVDLTKIQNSRTPSRTHARR